MRCLDILREAEFDELAELRVELVDSDVQRELMKSVRQDLIEADQIENIVFIERTERSVGVWLK